MQVFAKTLNFLSSLKVAIFLLFVIAISSAIGTAIPQGESTEIYLNKYQDKPWLGIFNGDLVLSLQLDHVYSSFWFLTLLAWLGLALIICSWKRQWPRLKSALKWIEYKEPKQILKLAVAEKIEIKNPVIGIEKLEDFLNSEGWQIKKNNNGFSARKGIIGRVGPPIVHFGLILLMIGSTLGALQGQRIENFIAPGRSIDLISPNKENKISFELKGLNIDRSPDGQPEQFTSYLKIRDPSLQDTIDKEISVNHPLRYKGLTIYQADWALAAITIKIGDSPKLQFPLRLIPELGDQVWGVILPNPETNENEFLITVASEEGPAKVFNKEGALLGLTRPKKEPINIGKSTFNLLEIIPSSGILIKYDPGVPLVYLGFAITLIGSLMSIISTRNLWVLYTEGLESLYIGGISNRDLTGFARYFNKLIKVSSVE